MNGSSISHGHHLERVVVGGDRGDVVGVHPLRRAHAEPGRRDTGTAAGRRRGRAGSARCARAPRRPAPPSTLASSAAASRSSAGDDRPALEPVDALGPGHVEQHAAATRSSRHLVDAAPRRAVGRHRVGRERRCRASPRSSCGRGRPSAVAACRAMVTTSSFQGSLMAIMVRSGLTRPLTNPSWGPLSSSGMPRVRRCPVRTLSTPRRTAASSMRLSVPISSSSPQRPQLERRL